jgi:hypothetical protein
VLSTVWPIGIETTQESGWSTGSAESDPGTVGRHMFGAADASPSGGWVEQPLHPTATRRPAVGRGLRLPLPPGGLRDELVAGIDEELEVRGRHLRRDAREAPLAQRDARHGDGVSPVVLAGLASRTSLRGGERRRDVEDPPSREFAFRYNNRDATSLGMVGAFLHSVVRKVPQTS